MIVSALNKGIEHKRANKHWTSMSDGDYGDLIAGMPEMYIGRMGGRRRKDEEDGDPKART